jgi:hypothetical protein
MPIAVESATPILKLDRFCDAGGSGAAASAA